MSDNKGHLVIKNGNVLYPDGELRVADVLLAEGQIREIGPNLQAPAQIDATAAYVLPGLIDLHTQLGLVSLH